MRYFLTILVFALMALSALPAAALKNPAAVYCTALGYAYLIETTATGDVGYCVFPDGEKVDAWSFLRGEIAVDRGFCAQRGYTQKVIEDPNTCLRFLTSSCAVCVLEDGQEVEVTDLMDLRLEETICGDGVCGIPETHKSCAVDCVSGSYDGLCDGVRDRRCDPDCTVGTDPDCL